MFHVRYEYNRGLLAGVSAQHISPSPTVMTTDAAKPPSILLVDDDELILSSLRGLFTLETDYDLLIHKDPHDALDDVRRQPIDLVISDFLMPQMNGVAFLREVRKLQPEAVRVLLTGFADKENAIRAINEVGLYQYLEKPWDNQDLLLLVRNALQQKTLRQQLTEKVAALDRLIREHSDLTNRHQILERELDMAARVQRSLLPSAAPVLDGFCFAAHYQPSAMLGGDYYDYARRDDATVVFVSDVSGHGVQASLVSMLIKASFHDSVPRVKSPAELLSEMNTRLHRFLPTGMYAAATLIWIPAGSVKVSVTNAGLPYPFVLRAASRRADRIPVAGLPLGLLAAATEGCYDSQERELETGDVVLVATDGMGEIRGKDDRLFEDEHLPRLLEELSGQPGDRVIERLLQCAADYSGTESYSDDISMVAITKT